MRIGYMVALVDSDEVMTQGVFPTPEAAIEHVAQQESELYNESEDPEVQTRLLQAYADALTEQPSLPGPGFSVRFEHTETSVDVLVEAIEVYL